MTNAELESVILSEIAIGDRANLVIIRIEVESSLNIGKSIWRFFNAVERLKGNSKPAEYNGDPMGPPSGTRNRVIEWLPKTGYRIL
jgi:hypothetical protein